MNEELRDALAEEQGYTICPLSCETYVICDDDCDHCELYLDFVRCVENEGKNGK